MENSKYLVLTSKLTETDIENAFYLHFLLGHSDLAKFFSLQIPEEKSTLFLQNFTPLPQIQPITNYPVMSFYKDLISCFCNEEPNNLDVEFLYQEINKKNSKFYNLFKKYLEGNF